MASLDDELEYLSPSFDPSSLTIPLLRNILMTHDVSYPASAKKPQLVDLFTQELKPKARKILSAREKVRRTSKGITDMPSSQDETTNGRADDDTGSMPPPPTPKQRKPRKNARTSTEPTILEASIDARRSTSRKSSSKHVRQSDTETDQDQVPKRPAARKSRKSETTPEIKVEGAEDTPVRPPLRGGVFSNENPFQSGSSPLESSEHRRRTAGSSKDRRKSSASRRKSEIVTSNSGRHSDGITPPTSKTFEAPLSRLKNLAVKDNREDDMEAGEDFTPEEQLELVRERALQGKRDILPPRRKRKSQKTGSIPKSAPWVIFTAILGGYTTWWRQEKLAVGYCGIGRPLDALSNVQIPEWASILQPNCELCPQHAVCYEGLKTRCEDDFVLQSHPLSLGGLIPLPPTCEPDGEKVRRVKAVADRAIDELRERNARAECGGISDDTGRPFSPDTTEDDLKKEVGKKRRRGMGDAEFDELWKSAIGEIKDRDEITTSGDGPYCQLRSTSLARLPFVCAIRRSTRLTLARHRLSLSLVTVLVLGVFYVRALIRTSRNDAARTPSLVAMALDRLATQAALYTRGDASESWISVGQLRDDVLRDEFSDKRRESMWKRVASVIERNANVRASVREGRGGDVSRVWEWIGSVGLLDDHWSGGRGSGAGKTAISGDMVNSEMRDGPLASSGGGTVEQRKWDEGRPIY